MHPQDDEQKEKCKSWHPSEQFATLGTIGPFKSIRNDNQAILSRLPTHFFLELYAAFKLPDEAIDKRWRGTNMFDKLGYPGIITCGNVILDKGTKSQQIENERRGIKYRQAFLIKGITHADTSPSLVMYTNSCTFNILIYFIQP